jgi:hypothetical protein
VRFLVPLACPPGGVVVDLPGGSHMQRPLSIGHTLWIGGIVPTVSERLSGRRRIHACMYCFSHIRGGHLCESRHRQAGAPST